MPSKSEPTGSQGLNPNDLAKRSADLMLEKKAGDVVIMDLRGLTSVTDFFVMGTGESDVQVKAIVDHLDETLRLEHTKPIHVEGYDQLSWVLMDYIDVVVHIFLEPTRHYYALEKLWGDAPVEELRD